MSNTKTSDVNSNGIVDDEPCAICGGYEEDELDAVTNSVNTLLLCDGCDLPFHLKCVGKNFLKLF